LNDVCFIRQGGTDTGFAVGDNGTIMRTTNGGESWTKQTSGTTNNLRNVCFVRQGGTDIGIAVGLEGTILRTTNGGQSWSKQLSKTNAALNSVFFTDKNIGTVVGANTILRTTNGGATWQQSPNVYLNSVYFADNNTGWAVGERGLILKTTDGGLTWTKLVSGASRSLLAVQFIDSETGLIVGECGKILKTTNGGITTFIDEEETKVIPNNFYLSQNYPNPFNPSTRISWQSSIGSQQILKVYDVLGREITTLVDEWREAGSYEVEFKASDLASGIYFYQLKVGEFISTKKMVLIR
jgi:photosystem II stability/assembly factor-like uncharacterized protein